MATLWVKRKKRKAEPTTLTILLSASDGNDYRIHHAAALGHLLRHGN